MVRLVDLSRPLANGIPIFHEMTGRWGLAKTVISTWDDYTETAYLRTRGKIKSLFKTCMIMTSDHSATHVDALSHIDPVGDSADRIPLEAMYGEALLLDVSHLKPVVYDSFRRLGPKRSGIIRTDYITVAELEKAATKAKETIRKGDILLIRTGAGKLWPKIEYAHYVVPIKAEALEWVLDQGVKLLGFDQITIDIAPDYGEPHMLMRRREFWHIENMNLEGIEPSRFRLVAFPLKLEGGSGAIMRPIALTE